MKLQELLRKCDFDRMFEYIVKFDSKCTAEPTLLCICPEAEKVPLDMIAGICLWHITFYGFNPDEEEETFNNMGKEDSSEDGPAFMVDILSEETKALQP